MAHVLGPDLREGGAVNADWEPFMLGNIAIPLKSKQALTQHQLGLLATYEWVVELEADGMPDIMGRSEPFVVSTQIRDWLVEHQPSQPDFYPIRLRTGAPRPEWIDQVVTRDNVHSARGNLITSTYYVMGHVPELDPIDVERTTWSGGMYGHPDGKTLDTSMNAKCVAHSNLIGELHIWQTSHRQGRNYMCSNAFWRFFTTNRLKGWDSWKQCSEI